LPPPAGADDDRFLAVIAHEIGHEEHRHVLRSVLQNSGVVLISVYFTGDVRPANPLAWGAKGPSLATRAARMKPALVDVPKETGVRVHFYIDPTSKKRSE
jgi:hypothetical protein